MVPLVIPELQNLDQASAMKMFEGLEPVDTNFMLGRWKGGEVPTGNNIDGILEVSGWYGKIFVSEEEVHPLVMYRGSDSLFALNPAFMPVGLMHLVPRTELLHTFIQISSLLTGTRTSKARLRMVEYRGKSSAAMVYDQLPIIDCFRKIDEKTVLGVMDMKGAEQPYFFFLQRDNTPMKMGF